MGPCGAQHSSMNLSSVLPGPTFALGFNSDLRVFVVTLCLRCPPQQCGLVVLVWENFAECKVTAVGGLWVEALPGTGLCPATGYQEESQRAQGALQCYMQADESCFLSLQVLGARWGVNGLM